MHSLGKDLPKFIKVFKSTNTYVEGTHLFSHRKPTPEQKRERSTDLQTRPKRSRSSPKLASNTGLLLLASQHAGSRQHLILLSWNIYISIKSTRLSVKWYLGNHHKKGHLPVPIASLAEPPVTRNSISDRSLKIITIIQPFMLQATGPHKPIKSHKYLCI